MLRQAGQIVLCVVLAGCSRELPAVPFGDGTPAAPDLAPQWQRDALVQASPVPSDVLFVVHDGEGMAESQALLAQYAEAFWQAAEGGDVHVGVTSSACLGTLTRAQGVAFVDGQTPDPADVLSELLAVGTAGPEFGMGRCSAYSVLSAGGEGVALGFMRADAVQHVVFVSDGPDASGDELVSADAFLAWMQGLKAQADGVVVHAVEPGADCGAVETAGAEGYAAYSEVTGGLVLDLCADQLAWGKGLAELGRRVSGLSSEFFLSRSAVPESVQVAVTQWEASLGAAVTYQFTLAEGSPAEGAHTFTYDRARNSVRLLGWLPAPYAEISVGYEANTVESAVPQVPQSL